MIIQVGQWIGLWPTLAILLLDGFLGACLARSQGRTAWGRFNRALNEGRVPARETFDGAMIIIGGAFLLAPGFITDIIGFALLIPPTRALMRGVFARLARRRIGFAWTVASPPPRRRAAPGGPRPTRRWSSAAARLRLRGHGARGPGAVRRAAAGRAMTEVLALEFTGPAGDPLRIEWQADALAALDPATADGEPVWRLGGELDWDEIEALRIALRDASTTAA